ncbi:MAG TPA: alginate lyase family protein [Phycisphaerae bacterium]
MQRPIWYAKRLRAMSAPEMWWRIRNMVQECADFCVLSAQRRTPGIATIVGGGEPAAVTDSGVVPGAARVNGCSDAPRTSPVETRAARIKANRVRLFDLAECDLGSPARWNFEHKVGRATPMGFAPWIDYRDHALTGDAKFVWEPNRHQHLVVLGRAFRVSGNATYARAVMEQIENWIGACPFPEGMNWRSPLELAVRLINWVWAIELIRPSGVLTAAWWSRVLPIVYRHLHAIARKYSRHSSANNHLVGEAAGVFIGSSYFAGLKNATKWRDESRRILIEQMQRQVNPDGGHCELATGYHLFVMEFLLLAGLTARAGGVDFPPEYWERLAGMFDFVAALTEGGGSLPMFGDADDGYVLDLCERRGDPREWLALGAALLGRGDFKAASGGFGETAQWLLGDQGLRDYESIGPGGATMSIGPRAFRESGYYLLQYGSREERVSVTFDCGRLGFGPLAAHGHADALSFTLRAFDRDIFVDPGTYDYFSFPRWRHYFRSTRAHNTVVVDGQDQSEMLGPFLWGRRAHARCLYWEPRDECLRVAGEHDGYALLPGRVIHRRALELDRRASELTISDELTGVGRHEAALHFHLAEHCRAKPIGENTFHIDCDRGAVRLQLDPGLVVTLHRGCEQTQLGWVSRGYHDKRAATTIVARRAWSDRFRAVSRIRIEKRAARDATLGQLTGCEAC